MHKMATTITAIAAVGTAAAIAYGCMKPAAKQQLKRDAKNAFEDMNGVKEEMLNEMCIRDRFKFSVILV